MALLTKEQILAQKQRKTEVVNVPEWGGDVIVRELKGKDRDAYEDSLSVFKGKSIVSNMANARARLLSLALVNEAGERLFATPEEIDELGELGAAALDRLFALAQRLSGFTKIDIESLTKNSSAGPGAGSS